MRAFRILVVGTLNVVAFIAFIAVIAIGVLAGMQKDGVLLAQLNVVYANAPTWLGGVVGGVLGYLTASVAIGILLVLLDIQDGIRDIERLAKERLKA